MPTSPPSEANTLEPDIVLASSSPRRRELLERLGVHFRVHNIPTSEEANFSDCGELVQAIALEKARAVRVYEPSAWLIAADTLVALDGEIMGKPSDAQENRRFLEQLSGGWHEVWTGLAIITGERETLACECTRVRFRTLSRAEIEGYVRSEEGLDKAGGYGIQGRGMALVESIEGDFFNIVGLPIARLISLANTAGLSLLPWVQP